MNETAAPYRFHAFEVSYFSAKVRPALRYKGLWYQELRADYAEIGRRTGLAFIPVLVTPEDETWQDTTEILERLEARHPEPPLFPATPLQRLASHLVELYTDEFATLPAMHYRWGSAEGEASARARFSAMMGSAERGGRAADRMAQARLALGASPEAAPAIEAHTRELLDALSAHFADHPYLLGERMSVADCALMGPCDGHFFTDPVSRRLLLETAWPVVGWIERCKFPNSEEQGAWLANDALAATFSRVLEVMGRDAAPLLLDTLAALQDWADSAPRDAELPRAVGSVTTHLRGQRLERVLMPYTAWMFQRSLDAYHALDADERTRADSALAGSGWDKLLGFTPRQRLTKRGFQLAFETEVVPS